MQKSIKTIFILSLFLGLTSSSHTSAVSNPYDAIDRSWVQEQKLDNSTGELREEKEREEVRNQLEISFIVGLILLILSGLVIAAGHFYEKISGKKLEVEKTIEGIVVVSRVKRIAHFAIDFFILTTGVHFIVLYIAINVQWSLYIQYQWIFFTILLITYYTISELFFGRTIGKFITESRVISLNGSQPTFYQILLRTLVRLIPFEIFSLMGVSPLGWHDKWSGTMVVSNDTIATLKKFSNINDHEVADFALDDQLEVKRWFRFFKVAYLFLYAGLVISITLYAFLEHESILMWWLVFVFIFMEAIRRSFYYIVCGKKS